MKTAHPDRVVGHAAWRARRASAALDSFGRQATRRARLLPNFFVIGAAKCGTSALFAYLVQHPEIGAYKHKEVRYFDLNYDRGLDWYRGHFPLALNRHLRAVGEASPGYIFHPHAPSRVYAFDPEARLIALVRDPVQRALSHYHELRVTGMEPLSFAEAIEAEPERVRGEEERMLADPEYNSHRRMYWSYLGRGRYLEQLERWLEVFPREQLLVVSSDDLAQDPAGTTAEALRFLGLAPHVEIAFRRHNERSYEPMGAALEEDLRGYFDEPNRRLYAFLGRDLGWPRPRGPLS